MNNGRRGAGGAPAAPAVQHGAGAATSQQNMRIRAFPRQMDENYVNQLWDTLAQAIRSIQTKNHTGLSFEELYRSAYTMVLHKQGPRLYQGLQDVVEHFLAGTVSAEVRQGMASGTLLQTLNTVWNDHTTAMVMIRDVLMYVDRVYVQQYNTTNPADPLLPPYNLGLKLFYIRVLQQLGISTALRSRLLELIAQSRNSINVDWSAVKTACQMLVELGTTDTTDIYQEAFERHFLEATANHYRAKADEYLKESTVAVYIQKVEEALRTEQQNANLYLGKDTDERVVKVLETELISKHMRTVIKMENSGVVWMLQNDRTADLSRLYGLLKRVPDGLTVLVNALGEHLYALGRKIVDELADSADPNPVNFVEQLIELKDQYDRFLSVAFEDDRAVKQRIQSEFERFLNSTQRAPEFLSLFIDDHLKKGTKTASENEQEQFTKKVMTLFRFLAEKDVFERYYKLHLSRRLLLGKSSSDEAEKAMVQRLKTECGCQFTQKLEGMFRDMETSNTVAANYRDWSALPTSPRSSIELNVRVLTTVYWPLTSATSAGCKLPKVAAEAFAQFEQFYVSKHSGRKVTVHAASGSVDLKATFYHPISARHDESQQEQELNAAAAAAAAGPSTSSSLSLSAATSSRSTGAGAALPAGGGAARYREDTKILQVNTHQMCILMLFNDAAALTYAQIERLTEIPAKELRRNLQSLAMGKPGQRVLVRRGTGRDIEPNDEFSINDNLQSKLQRIKIQMVSAKSETEPECKETRTKVDDDRRHLIEAAIVRIMKGRKELSHNELIAEVSRQLSERFLAQPPLIKARIEGLIEREYLVRDANDQRRYKYCT